MDIQELKELANDPNVIKLFSLLGFVPEKSFNITKGLNSDSATISYVPISKLQRGSVANSTYGKVLILAKPYVPYGIFKKVELTRIVPFMKTQLPGASIVIDDNYIPKSSYFELVTSDITSILGNLDTAKGIPAKTEMSVELLTCDEIQPFISRHKYIQKVVQESMTLLIAASFNFTIIEARYIYKTYNGYSWKQLLRGDGERRDFNYNRVPDKWLDTSREKIQKTIDKYLLHTSSRFIDKEDLELRLLCTNTLTRSTFSELDCWIKKSSASGLNTMYDVFADSK